MKYLKKFNEATSDKLIQNTKVSIDGITYTYLQQNCVNFMVSDYYNTPQLTDDSTKYVNGCSNDVWAVALLGEDNVVYFYEYRKFITNYKQIQ